MKSSVAVIISILFLVLLNPLSAKSLSSSGKASVASSTSNQSGGGDFSKTNLFTGDVSFSYPITEIGGIKVKLQYNSNVHPLLQAKNIDNQSGWVGLGWSLSFGSITADINNTIDVTDDKYFFSGPNGGSELIYAGDNKFKLKNYKNWDITRHVDDSGALLGWTIITDGGVKLRYGNFDKESSAILEKDRFSLDYNPTNATRFMLGYLNIVSDLFYYDEPMKLVPYQWDLSDIEDLHANHTSVYYQPELIYLYDDECATEFPYTRASYPSKIVDFKNDEIDFHLQPLEATEYYGTTGKNIQAYFETKYLDEITFVNRNNQITNKYKFDYVLDDIFSADKMKRYLTKVTESSSEDIEVPPIRFQYFGIADTPEGVNNGALKQVLYSNGASEEYSYVHQNISLVNLNEEITFNSDEYPIVDETFQKNGMSGTDFVALKMNGQHLRVYRWGLMGWYQDDLFPRQDNVEKFWVRNDYILIQNQDSLFICKRYEDGWEETYINAANPNNTKVLGAGSDYIVFQHNKSTDPVNSSWSNWALSTERWADNEWILDEQFGTFSSSNDSEPLKVSCSNRFFTITRDQYVNYFGDAYSWTGDSWKDDGVNQPEKRASTAGSDYWTYTSENSDGEMDYLEIQSLEGNWWTADWNTYSNTYTDNIYTGDKFFVRTYNNNIYLHTKHFQYEWDELDLKTLFPNESEFGRAQIAVGKDHILIGWVNNTTGKLAKVKLKNYTEWVVEDEGTSELGVIEVFEGLDGEKGKIFPIISNNGFYAEISNAPDFHQLKFYYKNGTVWQIDTLNSSDFGNFGHSLVQPGAGFIANIVDPYSGSGDEVLHLYKRGYDENSKPSNSGTPSDFPLASKTISDGRGNTYTTQYSFENGIYDEGIFTAKYNKVTVIPPGSNGLTETYFYNDLDENNAVEFVANENYLELDGHPYKKKVEDKNGEPLSEETFYWDVIDSGNECRQIQLRSKTGKAVNSIETKNNISYDTYGRIIQLDNYNPNSDEIKTSMLYDYNDEPELTDKHIFNVPENITVINSESEKLKFSEYEYDVDDFYLKNKKVWHDKDNSKNIDSGELITTQVTDLINSRGQVIQQSNVNNDLITSILYNENIKLPVAKVVNSAIKECSITSFEHIATGSSSMPAEDNRWEAYDNNSDAVIEITDAVSYTGSQCLKLIPANGANDIKSGISLFNDYDSGIYDFQLGKKYVFSAWVKSNTNAHVEIDFIAYTEDDLGNPVEIKETMQDYHSGSGKWELLKTEYTIPTNILDQEEKSIRFNLQVLGNSDSNDKYAYFDDVRIYPAEAYVTSYTYHPSTLRLMSKEDPSRIIIRYFYDEFGRMTQLKDSNYNILMEKSYFLSREKHDEYNSSDPNFTRIIEYNSELAEGEYGNLAPNYGFELDHSQNSQKPKMWKGDLYSTSNTVYSIVDSGLNNSLCIKLDNSNQVEEHHIAVSSGESNPFTLEYQQDIDWDSFLEIAPQPDGGSDPDSNQAPPPEDDYFQIRRDDGTVIVYTTSTNSRTTEYNVGAGNYYAETNGLMEGDVWYQSGFANENTGILTDMISIDAATHYYYSGFIKTEGDAKACLLLKWYNKNSSYLGTSYDSYIANRVNPGSEWTPYEGDITAPDSAFYVKLVASNIENHDAAYFDNIQFVKGNVSIDIQQHIVTSYTDGLGRNFQTQSIKFSPKDNEYKVMTTGVEYDELGRPAKQFLPHEFGQSNLDPGQGLLDYFSNYKNALDTYEPYDTEADGTPYYLSKFTPDISGRLFKTYAPGDDYNIDGERQTEYSYDVNTANEVHGYSDGGGLFKIISTDKTFGSAPEDVIENHLFKDAFGNVVETIRDTAGEDLHTIFKYDIENRLIKSFAPKGHKIYEEEDQGGGQQVILEPRNLIWLDPGQQIDMVNIAAFDSSKTAEIKLNYTANTTDSPSIAYSLYYYTDDWHLVDNYTLSDNGIEGTISNQHSVPGDAVRLRVTIDSIEPQNKIERAQIYQTYQITPIITFPSEPAVLDDFESQFTYNTLNQLTSELHPDDGLTEYLYDLNGNLRFKRDARYASNAKMLYFQYDKFSRPSELGECSDTYFTQAYAEGALPAEETDDDNELIKYIYDESGGENDNGQNLKGRLSSKLVKNHDQWSKTNYSYNRRGQVEWIEQHIDNLNKKIYYEYGLAGNVTKISYNPGSSDALYFWYEYDPAGALTAVYTNTADDRTAAVRELKYNQTDQAGRLTQLLLGSGVQTVDYTYDIHGRLKGINDVQDDLNTAADQFAMKLYYDEEDMTNQYYNGMISGYEIKYPEIAGMEEDHYRYAFSYDKVHRLKSAVFQSYNNISWQNENRYKVDNLAYDANGNILSLRRYDQSESGAVLHDLNYTYAENSNRLLNIDGEGNDYNYYANGSMQKDIVKDLEIQYNFLNLPAQITSPNAGNPQVLKRGYDDMAQRIYKKNPDGTTAYYIRGVDGKVMAEYNQDDDLTLRRLGNFGFITDDGDKYYYLKDHLGNIRVTVNEQGQIVTKDDYYPFGLQMEGMAFNSSNPNDHYKFSGKGLDTELNYDQYVFGWRDYDPKIGRWHVKDPLYWKEMDNTPYNYVASNPINNIDFVGLDIYKQYDSGKLDIITAQGTDVWFYVSESTGEEVFMGKLGDAEIKDNGNKNKGHEKERYRSGEFGGGFEDGNSVGVPGTTDFGSNGRTGGSSRSKSKKGEGDSKKKEQQNENLSTGVAIGSTIKGGVVEGSAAIMHALNDTRGLNALKVTGNLVSIFAITVTSYQIIDGQYSGRPGEAFADLAMGGVAFIPVWGWAASGAYFLVIKPIIKSGGN